MGVKAECLNESFLDNFFDLVYINNALDYMQDPMRGLQEMITVCKPGHVILVDVAVNEATARNYQRPHEWNVDLENNMLFINTQSGKHNVNTELASMLNSVTCNKSIVKKNQTQLRCILLKNGMRAK